MPLHTKVAPLKGVKDKEGRCQTQKHKEGRRKGGDEKRGAKKGFT
jgi:hypothetical protein